jgi:hypothetical protein
MAIQSPKRSSSEAPAELVAELLRAHGWEAHVDHGPGGLRPDLVARSGSKNYAVEVKSVSEGRPDRVIALLSQAILQASRHAERSGLSPLAIVYVGNASPSLQQKVEQFHHDYASDVAVGLVTGEGGSHFIGPGLDSLNVEAPRRFGKLKAAKPRRANDLFSDLNQWMLKVLLAPELPEDLLNAPRADYRSVSALAGAADVSLMSASRFVQRLREDGFLDDSGDAFRLVRRHELFKLWQSAALRSSPELRMSYVIPGSGIRQLQKSASRLNACIGLFAAADLLNLGHVSGVPPHLYVRRLAPSSKADWPGLVPSGPGEHPQIILRQASAPESMFRGAVRVDDVPVADVLQIWLDASAHPARGAEQADLLRRKVLSGVLGDNA